MTTLENERPETRGFRVVGRVQGVGFRWWTRGVAEELGLAGSVRNLPDGSVEVRARGGLDELAALEARLGQGPRFSRVDRVERFEVDVIESDTEFRIAL